MARILVTGATGFLGSHVIRSLIGVGLEPLAAARPTSYPWRLVDLANLSWIKLDVCSPESIQAALDVTCPDVIIHCAAYGVDYRQQDTSMAIRTNVEGTVALVTAAAAAGVQRIIHVGSCFEYGHKSEPCKETDLLAPSGLYGATKAAGSLLALERAKALGLDLCVVRPFGMYGPSEDEFRLVPQIIRACRDGKRLPVTTGAQLRDYSYVGDVAQAIVSILQAASFPEGEIFNLGSGEAIQLREFIIACARHFGGENLLDFGALEYRPNEMWQLVADISKWKSRFGSCISQIPLDQGLNLMATSME